MKNEGSEPAVVYFVECKDFIKIGKCMKHNFGKFATRKDNGNIDNRIGTELQGGNPFRLTVLGYIKVLSWSEAGTKEKSLHSKFKDLSHVEHLSPENYPENRLPPTSEWFRKSAELIEYIESNTTKYGD